MALTPDVLTHPNASATWREARTKPCRIAAVYLSLTRLMVSVNLRLVPTNQSVPMAALGDTTRRAIFELLAQGPSAVGQLANQLPVSRPAVSQHLKVLKEAGLVIDRAEGTRRLYQLDPKGLAEVRAYFDRFWNYALASFKSAVERDR
jgi:DNA-binding transcriptional ArsR family regulator